MKRTLKFGFICLIFSLAGCASVQQGKHYADMANEHDFEYFFPGYSFNHTFSTIEEAYEFVNVAQTKFSRSVNKSAAKGLAARLTGPAVENDKLVSVGCFVTAYNSNGSIDIDLSKIDQPLETVLRNSISVSVVFLVFYQDRGVSISKFYLAPGYWYLTNSQYNRFIHQGKIYETDYPIGWGIEKAFGYLKKEVN
ncbi:MAG: hypothetical protein LBK66_06205 [Spirochaetaceae bacterium]|jgi:hypothetical protein|nr:hypothetical protein [Spirochaetaceae bacterium]